MTHAYYAARGLDAFRILCKNFAGRTIALPDLICPDVIAVAYEEFPAKDMHFYNVSLGNWGFDASDFYGDDVADVWLDVDYFGMENIAQVYYCHAVIRDAVWLPRPYHEVRHDEYWFNSFRKITTARDTSLILAGKPLFNNKPDFHVPADSLRAIACETTTSNLGNFLLAEKLLADVAIRGFKPEWPNLFPMIIQSGRDDVMRRLREQGVQLPTPWPDTYGTSNPLYGQLMFLPLDSRFTQDDIKKRAEAILSACERG